MGEFRPMLAELAPAPFDSIEYLFEPKWDGVRCLAYVSDVLRLEARSGNDITYRFPEISREQFGETSMVLDGELICGDGGKGSWALISKRVHKEDRFAIKWASKEIPATLMVFDILDLEGTPCIDEPQWKRKAILAEVLNDAERVKHTDFIETEGIRLFRDLQANGYEGVMAKRRDGLYIPGKRSPNWLKVKVSMAMWVFAVGLTQGEGARADTFGALVLASREGGSGALIYRGEVGTGFTNGDLRMITAMAKDSDRRTWDVGKKVRWIEPIKCRVKFLDETPDGKLRFPVFLGLGKEE